MLKKLRIWYWIVSAFIKKYVLGLTIGSIIGIILAIYGNDILKILPSHEIIHVGRVGTYTLNQIPLDINQQISRGLTKINPSGEWEPDVAASITPSDEGKTYTVVLKPDLTWSDGSPLTTADLDPSIQDVIVSKPDSQTIEFKLKEAFAPFPSILSQPLLKKARSGTFRKRTQVIGLNEFVLQNVVTTGQHLKTITLKSPSITYMYHFYPTEEEALIAFKLGHIDEVDNMTTPYLEDWPGISIIKTPISSRYLALFFNTANQQLQDKTIRQMLAYATPKKTDDTRIISPIDKVSWAYNPQVKPYIQNLDSARSTIDKLKTANPQFSLKLTLTTTPAYIEMAQRIIDAWQTLGIETQLKVVPVPDTSDYEVLLIGQQVPNDPDQYPLWHSTQNTNIAHYQSPKIDKLLEDGRKESDKEQRKELYLQFQRFLVEDCPAVFLHELPMYKITRLKNS